MPITLVPFHDDHTAGFTMIESAVHNGIPKKGSTGSNRTPRWSPWDDSGGLVKEYATRCIDQAAVLLAARHRRDRATAPLLPARFEQPDQAKAAVEICWRRPRSSGMAALNHDQLVAYLFADLSDDPLHGRGAWVRLAGHALSDGVDAEWLRDLYTTAAGRWLEQGYFDHRVFIPAGDVSGRRAWFRLGFGANQSYALLDLIPF